MDQATLEEAIDRVVAGPARKSHVLTARGALGDRDPRGRRTPSSPARSARRSSAQKLSIVARGRQLGTAAQHAHRPRRGGHAGARHAPPPDRRSSPASPARRSSSASSPPASTTTSTPPPAWRARWSPPTACRRRSGPVTIGEKAGEVFLGASLQELGSVGPGDAGADRPRGRADRRRRRSSRREAMLERNWDAVYETANALIEHETLSGVALDAVLSTGQADAARLRRASGTAAAPALEHERAGRTVSRRATLGARGLLAAVAAAGARRRRAARRRSGASSSRRRRPGAPFKVPLGAPGDLKFWAPNRGLLDGRGQRHDPARHLQLGRPELAPARHRLRRPGRHGADRLGRARPSSGWSASRAGRASARAWRSAASRTARWSARASTRVDAADPFRQMISATCNGAERLLVRRRRLPGRRSASGSAPSTCTGTATDLRDRLRRRRAAGSATCSSTAARSSRARWSAARPENRDRAGRPGRARDASPAPAPPDRRRRLRQRPVRAGAAGRRARRRHRAAGARQRRHRALGGRRRRGVRARRRPQAAARSRGRRSRRGSSAAPSRSCRSTRRHVRADRPLRRRRRDPGHRRSALATVVPFAERAQRQQQGDGGADRAPTATTTTDRLPAGRRRAAAAPRGSPARRRTTAGWSPGPAGSSTTPTARRCRSTPTRPSRARSSSAPTRRPSSSSPTARRSTTRSSSRRRRWS